MNIPLLPSGALMPPPLLLCPINTVYFRRAVRVENQRIGMVDRWMNAERFRLLVNVGLPARYPVYKTLAEIEALNGWRQPPVRAERLAA